MVVANVPRSTGMRQRTQRYGRYYPKLRKAMISIVRTHIIICFGTVPALTAFRERIVRFRRTSLYQRLTIARAEKFEVTLPFVLQQAAWLYERQLSQVKAHMRRVGASKSSTQSPVPGSDSAAGEAMRRTGSGGGGIFRCYN